MAQSGYTPISLYYTTTAAAVPTSGNLVNGELAINITDGKLYYKNNSAVVTLLASSGGASGDVVGPASSTDNALARFDLATGKLIQNSVGLLSDAGILTGLTGVTSSGPITLSSLTSGRVTYAGTAGLLQDSANLTFNGTTLTANTIGAFTLSGTVAGGGNQLNNVIIGTTTPLAGAFTTLAASGTVTITQATNSKFLDVPNQGGTGYRYATVTNTSGNIQIAIEGITPGTLYTGSTAGAVSFGSGGNTNTDILVNNTIAGRFSSTGLAVTGTLSATTSITSIGSVGNVSTDSTGARLNFSRGADNYFQATTAGGYFAWIVNNTGTNAMTLDSSGNLGLGVTPSAWRTTTKGFQIGSQGYISGNTANQAVNIGVNKYINSSNQEIYITSDYASYYQQYQGSHTWLSAPSGTAGNAITFTQSLAVGKGTTLALEGATSATGTGIAFPATQSASTDANTLDDYEEGTWTPTQGAGLTVVGAFSSSGRYTKIGRTVNISGRLQGATSIATTAGTVMMGNLPFSVFESTAVGTMTNAAINALGGIGAFGTTAYSATTIGATVAIDFSFTYSV